MNKPFNFTHWSFKLSLFAALIAAFAVLGYRLSIVDFQPALWGLIVSTCIGLLATVLGSVGTLRAIKAKESEIIASTMAGSTLGLLVAMPVLLTALGGVGVPRIHDITTDLEHPPEFVAIKAIRTPEHNSLDRLKPENLALMQQEGYPDLGPAWINRPFAQVFEQAVVLVKKRGWDIAVVSAANGRIEATDTTPIMSFKDDIVIRVQEMGNRTRVDMRSVSRVGESDLGVNAKRIRLFLTDLGKR
ncbi:DUF1499 domain-containing protein [Nitrosomonas sp. Nm166]|uniref:DUF1499 domain-containing protein n=1 Tax=Nitrosomonas sp. Nm166 TaxID=1881054 RepID=UPI0008E66B6F|nr:DUF1499 domain-containing protein [Nitrosomonas sp. Nm166]SFE37521.1 Protein of unknown function [Nitrosomonas sp. Nm166]